VVSLAYLPSYSYSEQVFGTTTNAASAGYNWVMTNILPQQTGLTVSNVIYRYTTVKNTEDAMYVYVQNENPIDGGYTFREVDDWTGIPGNTINKVIPIGQIPIQYWGDGSIEWTGSGTVEDPFVAYTYQYDTCFDPQSSPDCPGYKQEMPELPPVPDVADPLNDEFVQNEIDREMNLRDEDEEEQERLRVAKEDEDEEEEIDLEAVLGIVGRSLQGAEDTAKQQQMIALNAFSSIYFTTLPDTKIEDTVVLKDSRLPRNNRGRRLQFAQDLLHEKMVKSQYRGEQ
jgi:hypothetical protein